MKDTRYINLKVYLTKKGIKHAEVAKMIGMNPSRFSQKINRNKSDFTIEEASAICSVLRISMDEYFFNNNFSKMRNKVGE